MPTIIFDADDTLWPANHIYAEIQENYLDWVQQRVPDLYRDKVKQKIETIQSDLIKREGFTFSLFTEPYVRMYQEILSKKLQEPTLDEIITIYNMNNNITHYPK